MMIIIITILIMMMIIIVIILTIMIIIVISITIMIIIVIISHLGLVMDRAPPCTCKIITMRICLHQVYHERENYENKDEQTMSLRRKIS